MVFYILPSYSSLVIFAAYLYPAHLFDENDSDEIEFQKFKYEIIQLSDFQDG